jgi:hypothetical protein
MGGPADELSEGSVRRAANLAFERSSKRCGFKPMVAGADRHGSFVWEATKRNELTRSITVSLTPRGDDVVAESWATASDGERFTRREAGGPLLIEGRNLYKYITDGDDGLLRLVLSAAHKAGELKLEDLTESYSLAASAELPAPPTR